MSRKMKLPNGFGQISKIKGRNLRKPYRAMVTIGKNENGRPIVKTLKPKGYFETYNDAYTALLLYNKNPYDFTKDLTMQQVYEQWFPKYTAKLTYGRKMALEKAWKYCSLVHDLTPRDLKPMHIKLCMDEGSIEYRGKIIKATDNVKIQIKTILSLILDYAIEYDLTDKNVARSIRPTKLNRETKNPHKSFTKDEMNIMWKHQDNDKVKMILIQCYSGWRPQELLNIKLADIDTDNWTFTGGSKTASGKNRVVPIHSKVLPFVKYFIEDAKASNRDYLFPVTNYKTWIDQFIALIKELKVSEDHRPHDCRKHFVTIAKEYKVDEYAIKRIVGHSITDLTEKVYTDRSIEWLKTEIEKIK